MEKVTWVGEFFCCCCCCYVWYVWLLTLITMRVLNLIFQNIFLLWKMFQYEIFEILILIFCMIYSDTCSRLFQEHVELIQISHLVSLYQLLSCTLSFSFLFSIKTRLIGRLIGKNCNFCKPDFWNMTWTENLDILSWCYHSEHWQKPVVQFRKYWKSCAKQWNTGWRIPVFFFSLSVSNL